MHAVPWRGRGRLGCRLVASSGSNGWMLEDFGHYVLRNRLSPLRRKGRVVEQLRVPHRTIMRLLSEQQSYEYRRFA